MKLTMQQVDEGAGPLEAMRDMLVFYEFLDIVTLKFSNQVDAANAIKKVERFCQEISTSLRRDYDCHASCLPEYFAILDESESGTACHLLICSIIHLNWPYSVALQTWENLERGGKAIFCERWLEWNRLLDMADANDDEESWQIFADGMIHIALGYISVWCMLNNPVRFCFSDGLNKFFGRGSGEPIATSLLPPLYLCKSDAEPTRTM